MNSRKLISGIIAVTIYFLLLFVVLYNYNIHHQKAKNYVEKNSNRVTVTLVNSDKTVFNRSDKISIPKRVQTTPPSKINKKKLSKQPKKEPKIEREKKREDSKRLAQERKKHLAEVALKKKRAEQKRKEIAKRKKLAEEKRKEQEAKKARERKRLAQIARNKKKKEQERVAEEARKKAEAKRRKERLAKEREERRLARIAREKKEREEARSLFDAVDTNQPKKHTESVKQPSRVKHNNSAADRIKNSNLNGQVADKNREKGVEDAYKAKVQRQLNNWGAAGTYEGDSAVISFIISSNGHFRYTIIRSSNSTMSSELRKFLDQLNRVGLGSHTRSRPYEFRVTFRGT